MDKRKLVVWVILGLVLAVLAVVLTRPATPASGDIGNAEFRKLQGSGAFVVDVRTPEEFAQGHIAGALNVPLDSLTAEAASWPKDRAVVVYCATGARSLNASQWLLANGFTSVYNLKSGIAAWDGETTADGTAEAAAYATNGKPVFIDFYSPT